MKSWNQQGQATALQIAELLTRTRLAALLKCCNLKLGPAGAGNCSTDLSAGNAELLMRTGAGNCLTDLSTGIAELLMRIRLAALLKRCNLKFDPF
jgi:hypothetical protein